MPLWKGGAFVEDPWRTTAGDDANPPLAGGVILGVAQAIGAKLDPGWQILAGHIAFMLVLAIRPQGLLPRVSG